VRHDSPPLATATFMDVGQGDAILVAAGRVQALIDGGPGRQVLTGLGRAMPLTDRLIEYVIVTHPHADHVGGLAAVFGRYQVGRLILGGAGAATPEFAALRLAAVAQGVPVSVVRSGDSIRLSDDAALAVVHTAPASILRTSRDINEESLVLLLSVSCPDPGGAAGPASCGQLLLTGDAGAKTEAALLDAGDVPAADILKVGHHGSRQATTYGFLTGVQPRTAVISVGQNYYGHPSPALLKRLAARGIKVWRTDVHGDVVAVFGQAGVSWRSRRGVPP
jgi:competence protein ComEC